MTENPSAVENGHVTTSRRTMLKYAALAGAGAGLVSVAGPFANANTNKPKEA